MEEFKDIAESEVNPLEVDYDEAEAIRIFEEMKKIEGLMELFYAIMGRDMKLHWMAEGDMKRENIKGHYAAFAWMRGIMQNLDRYKGLMERKAQREAK